MKKLLVIVCFGLANIAHADLRYEQRWHHDHYTHVDNGMSWVGPAILGGIITYELTRPPAPQPVVVQPPIIVQQPQVIQTVPPAPVGYHWENILDANCKCYRTVLIQN